jgi:hypothetical protein
MEKAEKKIVFANFYFWQRSCQLLYLAEFCQRRFSLPKKIEPSMNATSSHVPTAKSGWLPKKKLGTLDAKKKVWHDPCQK